MVKRKFVRYKQRSREESIKAEERKRELEKQGHKLIQLRKEMICGEWQVTMVFETPIFNR